MRRYLIVIVGAIALLYGALALALGSASLKLGSSSRGGANAASPACLPSSLDRSAALPGTSVDVSPAPNTVTANPHTQVSFLGVPARQISAVAVIGARSGGHAGRLLDYSQGDGASFVPSAPFDDGERVTVRAQIGAAGVARRVQFAFRVDYPYPTASTKEFPNPAAALADEQSFYTAPGVHAPVMTVTTPDADAAAGDIFTTNGPGPGQYGPLIYEPHGKLVWFKKLPAGETAEDLSVQSYEGQRELTWWRGRVLSLGFGQGEDIVMNDRYQRIATVHGGNGLRADLHDFQLQPHGVAYITAYNPIRCDLTSVKGKAGGAIVDTAIQEIDMRTGLVRWEWHSLDHVGPSESEVETPDEDTPWDYFHLNAIDHERGGAILITARNTWAAYQLEAGTGVIEWRLGGNRSSFRMAVGTKLAWQHDGRMQPDGQITFFDDGSNPPIHAESRAVRIALDLKTREAHLVSSFVHREPALLAASQGDVQTLSDQNTLVGYGGVPEIAEYSHSGSLLFDAHLPFDMIFYRAFRFPWSARPAAAPAVLASLNDTAEETIVHASWNGATGVAAWRVLAGPNPSSPAAHTTVADAGFETSTILPKRYAHITVQALDSSGRVLASSPTVGVISYAESLSGGSK
jgi:hypothetical protein